MLAIKPSASCTSNSTLTPSQEWVIPPRPKPGRKPKTDEPQSKRKAQNRESQRAFRTRKAEYLTSLEQKVQEYEKQDGEKSVYFQGIAKKFKEENDKLREENKRLKEEIEKLKVKSHLVSSVQLVHASVPSPAPSPPESSAALLLAGLNTPESPSSIKIPSGGCGLCSSPDAPDCLCRDVLVDQPESPPSTDTIATSDVPSIVPLKRPRLISGNLKKVWHIEDECKKDVPKECSGDPNNCAACQDDSFGQNFCSILSKTMCSNKKFRCEKCPSNSDNLRSSSHSRGGGCCGDPEFCTGTLKLPPCSTMEAASDSLSSPSPKSKVCTSRTVLPANLAWSAFKEHPNIQFTDLHLLASVVAAHSHCEVTTTTSDTPKTPPLGFPKLPQEGFEPPRQLVPQNQLERKRVVVEMEGVEEAIRLLDKGAFAAIDSDSY